MAGMFLPTQSGSFSYTDIDGQVQDTSPAIGDEVATADISASALKKVVLSDLFKVINGLTADASPDNTADLVVTYDASASGPKKVILNNILGGVRPMFYANRQSTQAISSGSWTKVQMSSEIFDTNGDYDPTTNFRFTPTVTGYYIIMAAIYFSAQVDTAITGIDIRKNGSAYAATTVDSSTTKSEGAVMTCLMNMNGSSDYCEVFAYQDSGADKNIDGNGAFNFFMGARVI